MSELNLDKSLCFLNKPLVSIRPALETPCRDRFPRRSAHLQSHPKQKRDKHECLSLRKSREPNARLKTLRLCCGRRLCCFFTRGTLDTRGLALQIAQVIKPRAPHATLADHVNRSDRRRVQRENTLHADAEAHAPHRECRAARPALLRYDHTLK